MSVLEHSNSNQIQQKLVAGAAAAAAIIASATVAAFVEKSETLPSTHIHSTLTCGIMQLQLLQIQAS